ncbi:MAG: molybdopterin molybdotransferase MoeA [Eubacterium sp.]|nr:molybdopterin molybdotransferase MoeA [Eubacterium sp.]
MKKISLEEAIDRIEIRIKETETVDLLDGLGRISAEDVRASVSQPPFVRSAMDGYAFAGIPTAGKTYRVCREIYAGNTEWCELKDGETARIMTGAPCPANTTMVIPQEMSDYGDETVLFHEIPKRDNMCPVGEDFREGDLLLQKGCRVDANAAACMAAAGREKISVYRKPGAALIAVGDEIVKTGTVLRHGQIYESNLPYLKARLMSLGCDILSERHAGDELAVLSSAIKEAAAAADFVITTGGVSVGKKDLIEAAVEKAGGRIVFHGIDVKPGMPTMYSTVNGTGVLSLSGNPFAARCLFELLNPFGRTIISEAELSEGESGPRAVRRFVPGFWDGRSVKLSANRKNGSTKSSIGSNCLAELPCGSAPLEPGSKVRIFIFER